MSRWPMVSLGEILHEEKQRVGTADADNLPLLGVSNAKGLHRSSMARIGDMSRYLRVEQGWFAYNPMRINVGSIGWAKDGNQTGVISPDYVVFSCTESVRPELVYWFLKHRRGLQAINAETAGSVRERLYFDSLARIEFPLPPLDEQRRMVERIDALAAKIEEASRLRTDSALLTKCLEESSLEQAIPWGEAQHTLGTLVQPGTTISYGVLVPGPDVEGGVPFVRVQDLDTKHPSQRPNKAIDPSVDARYPRTKLRGGEVLLGVVGSIGKVGIAPPSWAGANIARAVCRIFPGPTIDGNYLALVLQSRRIQDYFQDATRTLAQPTLNVGLVEQTMIPTPPLNKQREIIRTYNSWKAKLDLLKETQGQLETELSTLLPAILDRAFRGELSRQPSGSLQDKPANSCQVVKG